LFEGVCDHATANWLLQSIFLFLVVTIQFGHTVTHLVALPILKASHCTIFSILLRQETLQSAGPRSWVKLKKNCS